MISDPLLGQTLGQYQIVSRLGKGGMATVYRARQTAMQRDVAIKIMSADLVENPQFVARFEREARVIANLQHPRILPVHDFGHQGDIFYLVMRLIEGQSLYHQLLEGALPLRKASKYLSQIAEALDYAHAQGVVHRDLKPNNVLIDEWDNLYLMDFGLAKMLAASQSLTQTGTVLGTPAYMAPEQWRGGAVDARTDVYALGVILYEMVAGHTPFESDTPFTLMYKHLNDPPPPLRESLPDMPQAIEDVIFKALAKEGEARYASAGELAQAFAEVARVAGSLVMRERLRPAEAAVEENLTPATQLDEEPAPVALSGEEAGAGFGIAPAGDDAPESPRPEGEGAGVRADSAAISPSLLAERGAGGEVVLPPDDIIPPPARIIPPPPPIPLPGGAAQPPERRAVVARAPRSAPPAAREPIERPSSVFQQVLDVVDHSVEIVVEKVAESVSSPALDVRAPDSAVPINAPAFALIRRALPSDEPVLGVLDARATTRWQNWKRLLAGGIGLVLFGAFTQVGLFSLIGLGLLAYLGYGTYQIQSGKTGRYFLGFTPEQIILLPRDEDNTPLPDDAYLVAWSEVRRLRLTRRYLLLDFPLGDDKTMHFGAWLLAEGDGGLGSQLDWLPNSPITGLLAERGFDVRHH